MESKTELEVAAVRSARKLGYSRLKEHQLQVSRTSGVTAVE